MMKDSNLQTQNSIRDKSDFPFWSLPVPELFRRINSGADGLQDTAAAQRSKENPVRELRSPFRQDLSLLLTQFRSPLVLILVFAVIVSYALGEYTNSIIILCIVLFSSLLGFWQERNANKAISMLRKMVQVMATVKRAGVEQEVPVNDIVVGDVVILNAGDIIPGDCRLLEANDLHVDEASLTGESFPAEKFTGDLPEYVTLNKRNNCVFKGTSVVNGTATALVLATGVDTQFGTIAARLEKQYPQTAFETGIRKFGFLLMQITVVIATLILSINIFLGRPVIDSLLFALALAIGMTPELLPAIVTVTLSAGARRMANKKVIVKRLSAIQNLGSVDIFCCDKTGTLTDGTVQVQGTVDMEGNHSERVKEYGYLNAFFETGFTNPIDTAIRALINVGIKDHLKYDEVPYDFIRKRLSIVVSSGERHTMITKGAVKNILEACTEVELNGSTKNLDGDVKKQILDKYEAYSLEGFRTIAIGYKDVTGDPVITKDDEANMIFLGFLLLFDPPKSDVAESLKQLRESGITVKLITGDNLHVARFVSAKIGLVSNEILTGSEITHMSDEALAIKAGEVNVFSETEPHQKERIVRALQKSGHVVGFLGDGINDVSAMKAADISISVDTAVDIAKETADLVLLQKDLQILKEGIHEGRRTFTNTMKYIFITTSANFGNMFSMAGISLLVPFLPLLPKQILLTNFLTDLPAMTIASDNVDQEMMLQPRKWSTTLIRNFMLVFGLESSLFDFLSFFVLLHVFHAEDKQFQTGWFLISVITEVMILFIIRTRRSLFRSKPGPYLALASAFVVAITVFLPYSPIKVEMGFVPLPVRLVAVMGLIAFAYGVTTEITKRIFFHKSLR